MTVQLGIYEERSPHLLKVNPLRSLLSIRIRPVAAIALVLTLFGVVLTGNVASAHSTVIIPADDHVTVMTLTLKQGYKVDYSYTAQGPVQYEITLIGGSNLVSMSGLSASGQFKAPADGTYSFRFENQNADAPVEVTYSIKQVETSMGLVLLLVFGVLGFLALIAIIGYILLRGRSRSGQPPAQ